jgi:hypothetical protein
MWPAIGTRVRVLGRVEKFRIHHVYLAAGFIPAAELHTLDEKRRCASRIVDMEPAE